MRAEAETANEGKAKKRLDMVRWIAAFQSMALAAAANKVLQKDFVHQMARVNSYLLACHRFGSIGQPWPTYASAWRLR